MAGRPTPAPGDKGFIASGFTFSRTVVALGVLIALLATLATVTGLTSGGGLETVVTTTSPRGQSMELHGHGLYRYDSTFMGAGNQALDAVVLFLGVPLLVISLIGYLRRSLRAALLLTGTLAYFLYVYASYAFGVAFNTMFFVYVAAFSASLYAFITIFSSYDRRSMSQLITPQAPRVAPAVFMVVSGLVTLIVWGLPVAAALLSGSPPERLDLYTTKLTEAMDLATITPATFIAGFLILRKRPLGYLIACSLLVLEVMLLPQIVLQTVFQIRAGIEFPLAQLIGPIAGFAVLATLALWVLAQILAKVSPASSRDREPAISVTAPWP